MTHTSHSADSRRRFLKGAAAATLAGVILPGSPALADDTAPLPDYAPIPPAALGPAVNADGYFVGRIAGNLYWVTDSNYQAMFLSTTRGVVLVDAPPSLGHNLLRAIDGVTKANGRPRQVTHLIYSHFHSDHISAAGLFGSRVVRIAHAETATLLAQAADPNRPLPTRTFRDTYQLDVGGETLQLSYHGPSHSLDTIFIYAPAYSTLMLVDVLFPGWAPFKNLAVSADVPGWIKAQHVAMQYPWKTLVGGHLGRLGTRADGELQIQYMNDLDASTRAAIASTDPTPFGVRYGRNSWAFFKAYLNAVIHTAAAPVSAKYTGILAGADVFTVDNTATLLDSLRLDTGVLGPFGVRP